MRSDKMQLDADLTMARMRVLTLQDELILLKNFEKKDNLLTVKLEKCRTDKAQVVADIADSQDKLAAKKAEIDVWQEKDKFIINEFNSLVGESNQFYDPLLKIFKKRIKRSKKKSVDDEMSDSDEESDYDSDEDSDYDSEEEELEDQCPFGCEQQLYEKVLELREKRLDQEDILAEFGKAIDDLRKANERQTTKERQIDK